MNVGSQPDGRPVRDTDALEGRVVVLENENKRLMGELLALRERVARLEAPEEGPLDYRTRRVSI